jgi:hypothetical protein
VSKEAHCRSINRIKGNGERLQQSSDQSEKLNNRPIKRLTVSLRIMIVIGSEHGGPTTVISSRDARRISPRVNQHSKTMK